MAVSLFFSLQIELLSCSSTNNKCFFHSRPHPQDQAQGSADGPHTHGITALPLAVPSPLCDAGRCRDSDPSPPVPRGAVTQRGALAPRVTVTGAHLFSMSRRPRTCQSSAWSPPCCRVRASARPLPRRLRMSLALLREVHDLAAGSASLTRAAGTSARGGSTRLRDGFLSRGRRSQGGWRLHPIRLCSGSLRK